MGWVSWREGNLAVRASKFAPWDKRLEIGVMRCDEFGGLARV